MDVLVLFFARGGRGSSDTESEMLSSGDASDVVTVSDRLLEEDSGGKKKQKKGTNLYAIANAAAAARACRITTVCHPSAT